MFFAYSYKGTKPTNMPRPSRHRGKEVKKRGISKEQVCVATALDRHGNLIIELLCTGRMTSDELERLYGNRIGEHSNSMYRFTQKLYSVCHRYAIRT